MSNSRLIEYVDTSTINWNTRKYDITRITIHHAAGVLSLSEFSDILKSGKEVSWNYAISNDGKIGLYVEEKNRAWTSSNRDNDNRAITIEVSNSATGGNWPVSASAYNALLNLCEDICRRNNIPKLTYTGTLAGSNLTMHKWFASTECPGPYLESKFGEIANTVNARLGNPSTLQYVTSGTDTAYSNSVSGGVSVDPSQIDTDKIDEYVLTLNRMSPTDLNYDKLKSIGVIGSVLEGGYLYDSSHSEQTYRNPNLGEQVSNLSKYGLPFGLYFDVKSTSIEEANKELYHLSLCVRKYSPLMGVWLRLKFNNTKSMNEKILDRYYFQLVRLGLKDKVGLYVTKSELNKISWSKYKDTFYLWVDSHISSIDKINELETPEFFKLSNMN